MDVIKVFSKNEDGTYDIAESTHRFRGLKNIHIDNLDVEVPCAILHWKDKSDQDEIQRTIIDLNLENARQALQSAFEKCNFNLDDFTDKDR